MFWDACERAGTRTATAVFHSKFPFRAQPLPNVAAAEVTKIRGTLTNVLSDKRLSLFHKALNENMIVYGNHNFWSMKENQEIIKHAVDIYLQSKRHKKLTAPIHSTLESQQSSTRDENESDSEGTSSDSDSDVTDSDVEIDSDN